MNRLTPRPAPLCLLLAAALAGSCVTAPPRSAVAAPPARLAVFGHLSTSRAGYVIRLGYFTAPQARDSAWEARRLEWVRGVDWCPGAASIVRRETLWYRATPSSGQSCAAFVYTVRCAVPRREGEDSVERDRQFVLRDDPDPPIGADCGDKDGANWPMTVAPTPAQELAPLLSSDAVCAARNMTSDDPIRLYAETRIHVRTLIDPAFSAAFPSGVPAGVFRRAAPAGLLRVFARAALVRPRLRASAVEDDGVNILVTQTYALDRAGRPYCVELTARQGARIWRRHVAHPGFVEQRRTEIGIDREGRSADPRRFWSPTIDAVELGMELGASLMRRSDPAYRRGRTSRRPA
jgi:hypothetical protein